MVKIVDGKPVQVPDDERITPEMKAARTSINAFLAKLAARGPEVLELERRFREGRMSDMPSIDWFSDPEKK